MQGSPLGSFGEPFALASPAVSKRGMGEVAHALGGEQSVGRQPVLSWTLPPRLSRMTLLIGRPGERERADAISRARLCTLPAGRWTVPGPKEGGSHCRLCGEWMQGVALVTKALSRAAQGGSATTKWRVAETCNGCRVLVALASRRHCFLRKSCLCPTWGDDDTLLCAPCYDDSPWGFAGRRVQSCPSLRIDGAILSLEILHSFLHARICLSVWLGISSELRPRMDFVSLVCGIPPVGPGVGHGKEEGRRGVVTAAHHFAAKKDAMTNAQRVVSIQGKTPTTFMVLVAPASESNILGDDDWDVFGQLVDGGARFCVGCSLWK